MRFILPIALTFNCFFLAAMTPEPESRIIKIGDLFYTHHALERMRQRSLTPKDIAVTLKTGEHFRLKAEQEKNLCIDRKKEIAIYYNPYEKIIISAMREADRVWIYKHVEKKQKVGKFSNPFIKPESSRGELKIDTDIAMHTFKGKSANEIIPFLDESCDY